MKIHLELGDIDFADFSSVEALVKWGEKRDLYYLGITSRVFWCSQKLTYFRGAIGDYINHSIDNNFFYGCEDGEEEGITFSEELKKRILEVDKERDTLCRKYEIREALKEIKEYYKEYDPEKHGEVKLKHYPNLKRAREHAKRRLKTIEKRIKNYALMEKGEARPTYREIEFLENIYGTRRWTLTASKEDFEKWTGIK